MTNQNSEYTGTFCWVELETPDIKSAKAFYSEIMNWDYKEIAGVEGKSYTVAQLHGRGIGGITEGNMPRWITYIFVDNTDEFTQKAKSLGAKIIEEPYNVGKMGRMSTIEDPTGAQFCLWQVMEATQGQGPAMQTEPGSFCWAELATNDTKSAEQFYTQLFGWTTDKNAPKKNYTMFNSKSTMVGGMLPIERKWDIKPQWFVYFSVDDCDTRVEQAKRMKATVRMEPKDIPTVGRFSMLKDPQGVHVALIKLLPMNLDQKKK